MNHCLSIVCLLLTLSLIPTNVQAVHVHINILYVHTYFLEEKEASLTFSLFLSLTSLVSAFLPPGFQSLNTTKILIILCWTEELVTINVQSIVQFI